VRSSTTSVYGDKRRTVDKVGVDAALVRGDAHGFLEHPGAGEGRGVGVDELERVSVEAVALDGVGDAVGEAADVPGEGGEAAKAEGGLEAAGVADLEDAVPLGGEGGIGVGREQTEEDPLDFQVVQVDVLVA